MDFLVDMPLPPTRIARERKGLSISPFIDAHDEMTAYLLERVTQAGSATLDERLDLILEDHRYRELRSTISRRVPWEILEEGLKAVPATYGMPKVPSIAADRVVEALQLEHRLVRYVLRSVIDRVGTTGRHQIIRDVPGPQHRAMDLGSLIPYEVRSAMVYQKVGEVCGLVLMSERVVSSELANGLVDRWLRGLNSLGGLLVFAGLADADKLGIPKKYVIDRDLLITQMAEETHELAHALEMVEQTNRGYPEVYLSDEDDKDDEA